MMTEIQAFVDGVVDGHLSDSDVEAWMQTSSTTDCQKTNKWNLRMRCSILEPYLSGLKSGNIWW